MKFKMISTNFRKDLRLIQLRLDQAFPQYLNSYDDSAVIFKELLLQYPLNSVVKGLSNYYSKASTEIKKIILLNLNNQLKSTDILNQKPFLLVLFLQNLYSKKSERFLFYNFIKDIEQLIKSKTENAKTFLMCLFLQIADSGDFKQAIRLIGEIIQTLAPNSDYLSKLIKIGGNPSLELLKTLIHDFMRDYVKALDTR